MPVCSGAMKPQDADMFELPVVVIVPLEAVIGPVDCPPLGKVMIMFTVEFGSPEAETVQTWSRSSGRVPSAGCRWSWL